MAKYWKHNNLTVSGLRPGTRVFVATLDGNEVDEHVYNQQVTDEEIDIAVPEGELLLRMRGLRLLPFETKILMGKNHQTITVINVRDE